MTTTQKNTWIQTYTGRKFNPIKPSPEDVCIADIAHALSMKCRFSGMCTTFYSVAEHSVRVCDYVMQMHSLCDDVGMAGMMALLHDAAEAYLPDVPSPIKHMVFVLPDEEQVWSREFKHHEQYVHTVILEGLGLIGATVGTEEPPKFEAVEVADLSMLATEARDLMVDPPFAWHLPMKPLPARITPYTPEQAERMFLSKYRELVMKIEQEKKSRVAAQVA